MAGQVERELGAQALADDGLELEGERFSVMADQSRRRYRWAMTGEELVDTQLVGEVACPGIGARVVMVEDRGSGAELAGFGRRFVAFGNPGAVVGPFNGRKAGSDRVW